MAERIRAYNWAATPLGPVAGWSERLKLIVEQMLAHPLVSSLVCGSQQLLIYNDAAALHFGAHHPAALGRPLPDTFPDGWVTVAPYYARAFAGETVRVTDQPLDTRGEGVATDVFDALLTPVRDSDGRIAYVHMTGAEVGNRTQIEAALRESETRHRFLIESWAQAEWETDATGVVIADSPSWRAYTGQTLEEWLGYGWLNAIHPDDRAYAERQWREATAARGLVNAEFRLRAPDGGWRWTNVRAAPVLDNEGSIIKWAGMNIDIDARKRAEAELREREADLARVQRIGQVGGLDVDVVQGLTGRRSPEYLRLHGLPQDYDAETHIGWLARLHPDDRHAAEQALFDALNGDGTSYESEYRILRPNDGAVRWIAARADIERNADGKAVRLVGAHVDITEQKRAQAALVESERRYRSLFNTVGQGLAINELVRDGNGRVIDARFLDLNPAYEAQTGFERRKAIGRLASEIFPSVGPFWLEMAERVVETGQAERIERFVPDMGRWFAFDMAPFEGTDQFVVLYDNITDRKQVEIAARESEVRQAFLLKMSDALRAEPDADAVAYRALQMLLDHLGLDRCYIAYYRPDDDEAVFPYQLGNDTVPPLPAKVRLSDFPDAYEQVLDRTFVIEDDFERRGLSEAERANSKALGMRAMLASTIRKGEKRPLASMAAVSSRPRHWSPAEIALVEEAAERTWSAIERARDEAARWLAEERVLAASETARAQVTAILESIGDAFYAVDADYRLTYVNAKAEAMWGRSRETLIGRDLWAEFPQAVGGEPHAQHLVAMRDRRLTQFEGLSPVLGRWMEANLYPDPASGGLACYFRDITERKRAEDALHESEARFQQFADASAAGMWIRNANTLDMEYLSPALTRIYGAEADASLYDVKRWAGMVVPEDRSVALEHVDEARKRAVDVREFRIQRPDDGTFRWIRDTSFPLRDDLGRIQRIGGLAEDVTEAKLAIEHQGVLLAELQHRVRNIMGIIRSTANRTAAGAKDVADYRVLLEGRLLALARVQALLTREVNAGGSLRSVLESEIEAQAHHSGQYELTGPDIKLSPKAVEVLTLAFHELSTNALKYGALSVPDGYLIVAWEPFEKRGRAWLALDWAEQGAPPRPPSKRRGFGSELIEARIPYELGGCGAITIEPEGARCHLEFPLKEGESVLETDAPRPTTTFGGSLDMSGAPDLTGRTILVVEDDYYMASDTAAALRGAGAEVLGPCPDAHAVRDLLEDEIPTHAILDLNLGGGGPRFEVAQLLRTRGVPFVFLTGYDPDVIPADLAGVVLLQKPLPFRNIVEAVSSL